MTCHSTDRMIADASTNAVAGRVEWAPARSLWIGIMTIVGFALAAVYVTPSAVFIFLLSSTATLCLGHSIGLHRLLIHRSFRTSLAMERVLVYLGTLVGMAGPVGMARLHDMRDWAQRQTACHDFHAHRAWLLKDAWWQMHCHLALRHPPRFAPERYLRSDRFLRFLERTWMLQQFPVAILLYVGGGLPWLIWGVPLRIAVSVTGHWLVGHITHRRGPNAWVIDGCAVQGHDLPAAALITFGEAWHGNHHAWPQSARLGLARGQHDPGWWMLVLGRRLGLAWDLNEPAILEPRPGLRAVVTSPPARA